MGIVDEFLDIKQSTEADLLAMQVGDFYEFFSEDARIASKELGLKVSEKSSHGSSYPMAGVPINDLEDYVETLVGRKGYTVAVANQYEENGQHKRRITRIVTPGTLIDSNSGDVRYLCCLTLDNEFCGIALTDLSTGQIISKEVDKDDVFDEVAIYDPVEVLVRNVNFNEKELENLEEQILNYSDARVHRKNQTIEIQECFRKVREKFGDSFIDSLDFDEGSVAVASISGLLDYLDKTNTDVKDSISKVRRIGDKDFVSMDSGTRRSLEITETMSYGEGMSLFDAMDRTITSIGAKKFKKYLQRPLSNRERIMRRQESVSAFISEGLDRSKIREILKSYPDIQRIATKCSHGSATPKDVRRILDGISKLEEIKNVFAGNNNLRDTDVGSQILCLDDSKIKNVRSTIESGVKTDAPNKVKQGIIKEGYDEELDRIIQKNRKNQEWLEDLESNISDKNDITHLSVNRNKTDGYYIQVGNSETQKVPSNFNEIKNLKNSKRYKTQELKNKENDIIRLEKMRKEKEKEVFSQILSEVSDNAKILQSIGSTVAQVDAIQSFSTHAVENKWSEPTILEDEPSINIENGRHPIVEQSVEFVPNDVYLDDERRFLIVTGPNMAGKSTYLRQVALICLLAQCGSYVPCDDAELGIKDSIFTRVGSIDEISQGRSTFMVEMSELANILHSCTDKSLIILDEVGKGTSTNDGVSIAQSTIEHLANDNGYPRPITLFATHYHQLTSLADSIGCVENAHMAVDSSDGEYNFVRKIREGEANNSYGIEVADMAGVPKPVVDRSREILDNIQDEHQNEQ